MANRTPFLTWPTLMAPALALSAASNLARAAAQQLAHLAVLGEEISDAGESSWATKHSIRLELASVVVRDFSTCDAGTATLVCAPYAQHKADLTDFAPGLSLVEALRGAGIARLLVTDWKSACPEMRYFSIDTYLADLNAIVDDLGGSVNLVGLCQGGWLSLMYAARFPGKVRRCVLAGAPVDMAAGDSVLQRLIESTPFSVFKDLADLYDGLVATRALLFWHPNVPDEHDVRDILQLEESITGAEFTKLKALFDRWYDATLTLPGTYYIEVAKKLFKENQLAGGTFVALGRAVSLPELRAPLYVLAARDDEMLATAQVLAAADLVGTPASDVVTSIAPCRHMGLFMGREVLTREWPRIGAWLKDEAIPAKEQLQPAA